MSLRYNTILNEIYNEALPLKQTGAGATYIPELATIDPDTFANHGKIPDTHEAIERDYADVRFLR